MKVSPEQAKDIVLSCLAGGFVMLGCFEAGLNGKAPLYFGLAAMCLCLVTTVLSFSFQPSEEEK